MSILARAATPLALLLLSFVPAKAEIWPNRPIKIIVSQAAGGTPDLICRLISDKLSDLLGQRVVVENRPGGGNVVGSAAAAHAAADGYTLFFATAAALVSNPHTFKTLPYDPVKDFVAVAMVAKNPFLILANANTPANNLPELIAYDKANPGKLAFATDGRRNFSGILATWLNKVSGADILQVPYATMPQGVQDTLAGRTQLTILAIPSAAPHIASGALKPIAISWTKRLPQYAQVPSISEAYPGVELTGWFVIAAPAGTPADIITRLNQEMDKVLKTPDMVNRLADVGFFTDGADTPEATRAFVQAQYDFWSKIVHDIGLQPE
ncbi:MAG TPA: tripartite tricarboxylate transporter substrate binding protein [Pseudolabrys sp.]|nr:tripartite tricarboxylate transporter substrate binding protein [Pseudolabrys sp.]